ncbi:MAG: RluA family pseudouridine synthase [Polyangiaceae bacterium]|nr:RluA family pseudouridine synthase [Polyangiaceae bacterium]
MSLKPNPNKTQAEEQVLDVVQRGGQFTVPNELTGRQLDGALKVLTGASWSTVRSMLETGKIKVSGALTLSERRRVTAGEIIEIDPRAPKPKTARLKSLSEDLLVYTDASVVVVRKPAGISTVPFEGEGGTGDEETLDALVRDLLGQMAKHSTRSKLRGRTPLGVVQRLDKVTSGLIVFARTVAAKKHLSQQLRQRTMFRRYLAIAHGDVHNKTYRSLLIVDRGDGLRGSASTFHGRTPKEEDLAVTHVTRLKALRGATLIACRLETGRTHQIRIHLAEAGHPLVGEHVYIRNYRGPLIPAPRVMLHAAELGFVHPATEREMSFQWDPPDDFQKVLASLG